MTHSETTSNVMDVSVIVPTYRRTEDLERCLEALKKQTKPAFQVFVIVRDTDQETWNFLSQYQSDGLALDVLTIKVTGVIAALNAGLAASTGDVVTVTDDDSEAYPDWIEKISGHFAADPALGALGGKDRLYENGILQDGEVDVVGKLQWFGRPIGNHSQGFGQAREVDLLKGVNMSFRKSALGELRFDERMLGAGAQVHYEMSFCLALKRAGWKVVYDPAVLVNHFRAERFDEDQRYVFHPVANFNQVYNETLVLLDHFSGVQRLVFLLWAIVMGTRAARGFLQMLRFLPQEGKVSVRYWLVSMKGRWQAYRFILGPDPASRALKAKRRVLA
ncbi:MAG: glycosyltransferase family 2 protein [Cyanobacteria bacterium P01_F01_bin.42]